MHINGFDIYVKHPARVTKIVRRGIIERLFSLPFRPLITTKEVVEYHDYLKDGQVIHHGRKIFCNPATYEQLRKEQENV